jgi:truncated hemoglobin YjbI
MHNTRVASIGILLLLAGAIGGCGCCKPASQEPTPPLYEVLGKEEGIRAIAGRLVARARADGDDLNFTRAGTPNPWTPTALNQKKLIDSLAAYLTEKTGGPATRPIDLRAAHQGMQITQRQFDRFVKILEEVLAERGVEQKYIAPTTQAFTPPASVIVSP